MIIRMYSQTRKIDRCFIERKFSSNFILSLLIMFFLAEHSDIRFREVSFQMVKDEEAEGKRVKEAEHVRRLYFRSKGPVSGPTREREMADLKKFYCETNRKWFGYPEGNFPFLPAGFFVGLRLPTSIHSRLTLLFTVCGCLASFLPLIGIFFRRASTASFFFFFFAVFVIRVSDNDQWISIMSSEIELFWTSMFTRRNSFTISRFILIK